MNKLISVVGASGVGKTAFVQALARTGKFSVAYEQHASRPFQNLFKKDPRYALANQIDYLLLRAEQEGMLRASSIIGLMDGGLDLDFHGFTRLFHHQRLLTDPEHDLCKRVYSFVRANFPLPDLIVRLNADDQTIASRLSRRERVNIASAEDNALFNSFLDEWLASIPSTQVLELDVSKENIAYSKSVTTLLKRI
jgi:deoxyadenosine/deoxycytidine kinase